MTFKVGDYVQFAEKRSNGKPNEYWPNKYWTGGKAVVVSLDNGGEYPIKVSLIEGPPLNDAWNTPDKVGKFVNVSEKMIEPWEAPAEPVSALNEVRTTSATGGEKGVKRERYDLIPVEALAVVAQLYGNGAEKYEAHNWRKGYEWSKSYAALQRHASLFWQGEDIDEEMQLPHMAAVVFHALALITFMKEQPGFDDRFKLEEAK